MMASQRVPNIAGLVGYGSSPFGWMYPLISGDDWEFPFNQLRLRTWRDTARYMYEGMKNEDIGLPMLIELTFERWETREKAAQLQGRGFHPQKFDQSVGSRRASCRRTLEVFAR